MLELDTLQKAQAKALLSQLDPQTTAALQAVIREEVLPALREEALTLARAELAEELAKATERVADQSAAYRESLDNEVEDRISRGIEAARTELLQDVEDRLQERREARNEARQQRDAAEHQLLALLRQLLDEKGRYLRNASIEEFDQWGTNTLLKKYGWRIRSRATFSERTVKTKLQEGHWAMRTLFWLDTVTPDGVEEEPDDAANERYTDAGQAFAPDRLALPEGSGA
jgi:hypothetical protein